METALWIAAIALSATAIAQLLMAFERIVLSSRQMKELQAQLQENMNQAQQAQAKESNRRKQYYEGILGKKIEDATDAEVVALVRGSADSNEDEEK